MLLLLLLTLFSGAQSLFIGNVQYQERREVAKSTSVCGYYTEI